MAPIFYVVLLGFSVVGTGAVFLCPPGIIGVTDDTKSPCGEGGSQGDYYVEVDPGPFTIQWHETVYRPGSNFRVTLRSWDDSGIFCILQNRIPSVECQNAEGQGGCSDQTYYLTVIIPDVPCENCYLQITTIYPQGLSCMVNLDGHQADCPTFYSCASIQIRSNTSTTLRTCEEDYLAQEDEWPFKTTTTLRNYKVDFRDSEIFPNGEGELEHIPYPQKPSVSMVKYNISLNVPSVGAYPILNDGKISWNSTRGLIYFMVLRMSGYGEFIGTFPPLNGVPRKNLLDNKWMIAIRHKPERKLDLPYNTSYIPVRRNSEVYSNLSQNYTDEGWLTGPAFDGEGAKFAHVVESIGICSNYTTIPMTFKSTTSLPETDSPKAPPRRRPFRPVSNVDYNTPGTIIVCILTLTSILVHRVRYGICQRIF